MTKTKPHVAHIIFEIVDGGDGSPTDCRSRAVIYRKIREITVLRPPRHNVSNVELTNSVLSIVYTFESCFIVPVKLSRIQALSFSTHTALDHVEYGGFP